MCTGCKVKNQGVFVGYQRTCFIPSSVSFTYDVFTTGNPELSYRSCVEVTLEFEELVGIDNLHFTCLSERKVDVIILIGAQTIRLNGQVAVTLSGAPRTINRYFECVATCCKLQNEGVALRLNCIRLPCKRVNECTVTGYVELSRNDNRKCRILEAERVICKSPRELVCTFNIGRELHITFVSGNTSSTSEATVIRVTVRTPFATDLHLKGIGTSLDVVVIERSTQTVSSQLKRNFSFPVRHRTDNGHRRNSRSRRSNRIFASSCRSVLRPRAGIVPSAFRDGVQVFTFLQCQVTGLVPLVVPVVFCCSRVHAAEDHFRILVIYRSLIQTGLSCYRIHANPSFAVVKCIHSETSISGLPVSVRRQIQRPS